MTPEAQRIAIAEACGFEKEVRYYLKKRGMVSIDSLLRDYLTDLNAMHEAENVLTDEQKIQFATILRKMVPIEVSGTPSSFSMIHATAAQRAEAFLRTIGKWEDDK